MKPVTNLDVSRFVASYVANFPVLRVHMSPRMRDALRRDAIDAAAEYFHVDPETIRRHLRFKYAK